MSAAPVTCAYTLSCYDCAADIIVVATRTPLNTVIRRCDECMKKHNRQKHIRKSDAEVLLAQRKFIRATKIKNAIETRIAKLKNAGRPRRERMTCSFCHLPPSGQFVRNGQTTIKFCAAHRDAAKAQREL